VIVNPTYTEWITEEMGRAARHESGLLDSIVIGVISGIIRHRGSADRQIREIAQTLDLRQQARLIAGRELERERRGY
jgi:hypothetical protein